jgi:hypothetical protein
MRGVVLCAGDLLRVSSEDLLFVKGQDISYLPRGSILFFLERQGGGFLIVYSPFVGEIMVFEDDVEPIEENIQEM